jgi:predicted anti-sigma-YlaC factor YlaD
MKAFVTALVLIVLTGCSVKRIAVNKLGNALASGGSTYSGDDDPDLVGAALPFSLKLMESLLAESPKNRGLLLASASGFVAYSNLYVDQQADLAEAESLDRSLALRARARKLYLRAHAYGMRGLEAAHPGFRGELEKNPASALTRLQKPDVPLLYWTAAAQGLAISTSKDQADMIALLPLVEALIDRVKELDAGFGKGAVPEFLIAFEAGRSGINPDEQQKRIRAYYEEALQLSGGKRAGIYVSYAENSSLQLQKRAEFQTVLGQALRVDPDQDPDNRLVNLMAQRRARWLLSRIDELFLEARPSGGQQ